MGNVIFSGRFRAIPGLATPLGRETSIKDLQEFFLDVLKRLILLKSTTANFKTKKFSQSQKIEIPPKIGTKNIDPYHFSKSFFK